MPQNLELKARVRSLRQVGTVARRIGARSRGMLLQKDTYYAVRTGRLKMREIDRSRVELIAYDRPDTAGSRMSRYDVFPVHRPRALKGILDKALGVRVVVVKRRTLYLYQNCRIHADHVRGLGTFLEFEVLVTRGKNQARRLMKALVKEFSIARADVIGTSYSDLLLNRTRRKRL